MKYETVSKDSDRVRVNKEVMYRWQCSVKLYIHVYQ